MDLKTLIISFLIIAVLKNIHYKITYQLNTEINQEFDYLVYQKLGSIGKENFTYYSLNEKGSYKIILETRMGDADLYIAHNKKPECLPDQYDLSSATCGLDIIDLPSDFKKPIFVGVYGHPSYNESQYTLSIYTKTKGKKSRLSIRDKVALIIKNTVMWRVFELLEGIFFIL